MLSGVKAGNITERCAVLCNLSYLLPPISLEKVIQFIESYSLFIQQLFNFLFMKKLILFFVLLQMMCFSGFAQEQFLLPSDDGHSTKKVDAPITFYDTGGENGNISYWKNTTVCFEPRTPNERIEIVFESIDMTSAVLKIYNGEKPVTTVFDENENENVYVLPTGQISTLSGKNTNISFVSTASDGKLTVGFSNANGSGKGWKATVRSVVPTPMIFNNCTTEKMGISPAYLGKKDQEILAINIKTSGSGNPLSLKDLKLQLKSTDISCLSNIRIYSTGNNKTLNTNTPFGDIITKPSQAFSINGSQILSAGDNYFIVTADINSDATPSTSITASCTSATIDNEIKNCTTNNNDETVTIANEVRIQKSKLAYTIGGSPFNFYDDGGKEAKISEKFNGTITFKPLTKGNKVLLNFSKLALLLNTKIGNDDILKIYNGEIVDEASLNCIIDKNTAQIIKSTAPDGALTVTLKSVAGMPGAGFEATVEEFTPQQMEIEAIVPTQISTGTVAAGDANTPILSINIQTKNTEPQLATDSFSFNTVGTTRNSDLTKATLYYSEKVATFDVNQSTKIGEIVLTGNEKFTIPVTQSLKEGNNYFWLTYDINSQANNGSYIDAACNSISISSKEYAVSPNILEGNKLIKNEYISHLGKTEKTFYNTWTYTHTSSPYSSTYNAEEGNQTITFIPGTTGKVAEIEFSSFDVFYASSSYGTKATFKIYSGKDTNQANLLWELKNSADKNIGPNKIVRSIATDGALTIVFNANTTYSSNTGKGWLAQVREYQPRAMEIKEINATQNNTAIIKPGSTNQEIIGVEVITDGNLSPLIFNELVINTKSSQDKVKKVSVFYTKTNNSFDTTTLCGESTVITDNKVAIPLSSPIELSEGKSYFWVAYDMNDVLPAEQSIDAALLSVKIGNTDRIPNIGDPVGQRTTKNIYEFENGVRSVNVNGSIIFYDNGGSNANYSNTAKGTVTFIPKQGDIIKLNIKKFGTAYNDEFFIYNGNTINKDNLSLKLYGSKPEGSIPAILSNANDGSITVDFQPKKSGEGWEIEVISYTPQPLTLGEIKTTAINGNGFLKGMQNEQMLKVEVEVKGDRGNLSIDQFTFDIGNTTDSKLISEANLYSTDVISNFSTNKKYGNTQINAPYVFAEETNITQPGVYIYWLTYNIATTAKDGNKIEALLSSAIINKKTENISSATAKGSVNKGFEGTYTIGSSANANYPTVNAAIDAIKNGIEGPVVLEIENGTYNDLINIPQITGASSINTLTIKSKSGNSNDVIFCNNNYSEPPYSDDKTSKEYGVITLNGADYTTLEGVTITTKDLKFPSLVHVNNMSQHFTLRNCKLFAEMSTNYQTDINLVYMYSPNEANKNNDYITLENNIFEGGYIGANIGGTGYVSLPKEKGAIITKNSFINQGSKAIYLRDEIDAQIIGNTISNNKTDKSDYNAMDIYRGTGNMSIANNSISLATKNYSSAITLRPIVGNKENRVKIFNNEINFLTSISSSYGISVGAGCESFDITHNTIRMGGKSDACATILFRDQPTDLKLENNLLQNEADGLIYRANKANLIDGIEFGHNALYTSNPKAFAYAGSALANYDAWNALAKEKDSFVDKADFVSTDILELNTVGKLNAANPLCLITTDINGKTRSSLTPTIGAYEYSDKGEIPEIESGFPVAQEIKHTQASLKIKLKQNGKIFYLAKKASDKVPTKDEILATNGLLARKDKETVIEFNNLSSQTDYRVYIITQSLKGELSDIKEVIKFTTIFTPTAVSTFEDVTQTTGDFIDGTASFSGFKVETANDAMGSSKKVAKLNEMGVVTLTNSTQGLPLTGFYLKSDAEIVIETLQGSTLKESKTVASTNNKWVFYSLKNLGDITTVQFAGAGNIFIDDFSGLPQPITFMLEDRKVARDEKTILSADIYGGVLPFTYVWKNAKNEIVSNEPTYNFKPIHTGQYTLNVTDAWGNKSISKALITVLGESATATFDDLYLAPESHWRGDEESTETYSKFYSGSYSFSNCLMKEYETWALFGYSNETNTSFNPSNSIKEQFRSTTGSGVNGSANYAIVYASSFMGNTMVSVTNNNEGDNIRGCYVSNAVWSKYAIENGDGLTPGAFKTGDWFKLTAEGIKTDGTKASCDFYLADYRSSDEKEHYCINTWEWFDLSSLGKVSDIKFSMSSSRKNSGGITTPTYFCMDDFNGKRTVATKEAVEIQNSVSKKIALADYFSFNINDASINYKIEENQNSEWIDATITDGILSIKSNKIGKVDLTISATQKGRTEFINLPLDIKTKENVGINEEQFDNLHIFPIPATDRLNIATELTDYSVEVINTSGKVVLIEKNHSGSSFIDVNSLEKGIYLLKVSSKETNIVKRFAKVN